MKIPIKKLDNKAVVPTYGSTEAAGADLYANLNEPVKIRGNETVLVGTGISLAIPNGYVGLIFPRSGWAVKRGLSLANCVGVIDSDYRGEIKVALHNHTGYSRTIGHGDRLAQIVFVPFMKSSFDIVDELGDTERGDGGFGSTGK